MKNVASLFTQEARAALENQLGIALSDGHDYSDEELGGLYERITEEFPYSFDENGEPDPMGLLFESLLDTFITNKLVSFPESSEQKGN